MSQRKHLEQVYESSGEAPPELQALLDIDIPEYLEDIWNIFFELRRAGGVTYQNIYYYERVMGFPLSGEMISILTRMDARVREVLE